LTRKVRRPLKVQIDDPSKPTAFTMLMGDGRAAPRH
jgi:hypothetical protein